jgi:hypothetical protein
MFYLAIKLSILATLHNLALQTVLSATLMQQLTLLTVLAVAMLIVPSKNNAEYLTANIVPIQQYVLCVLLDT